MITKSDFMELYRVMRSNEMFDFTDDERFDFYYKLFSFLCNNKEEMSLDQIFFFSRTLMTRFIVWFSANHFLIFLINLGVSMIVLLRNGEWERESIRK